MLFARQAELSRLRQENATLIKQVDKMREYIVRLRQRKPRIRSYDVEMPLACIKVPKSFILTPPRPDKLAACKDFYQKYGVLDRKIIVQHGYCIDGYIGLLTLLGAGVTTAKVLKVDVVTV